MLFAVCVTSSMHVEAALHTRTLPLKEASTLKNTPNFSCVYVCTFAYVFAQGVCVLFAACVNSSMHVEAAFQDAAFEGGQHTETHTKLLLCAHVFKHSA